ncbi:transaldolase [Helcococcus ovis]|uniref:Transaldolase n=1 Tax=Helcococcus ovis TaxID=72026 RepID=A0A4R9C2K9_9FIRM|nr:transaldolase [Helcococcus ovis]TFF65120.1 transaldolase [Helcococcus ovis]TFF66363.1 transaldolase [Helcococcus ovis]
MKVKIYADGADINGMLEEYNKGVVSGFTTNPSLMKKAGVKDYKIFAKEVTGKIKDLSVSFEVFGDDFETMKKEALILKEYGKNVFVKIPIQNTKGESSIPLIKELSSLGVNVNVTAIFTIQQVKDVVCAVSENSNTIVSIFAGRIADLGVNPIPIMEEAVKHVKTKKNIELLWASTREVYNIVQADELGVDIITVQNDLLKKIADFGKDLNQRSLETVIDFNKDVKYLGFSIL